MPIIDRARLDEAVTRGIVSAPQADQLWAFLSARAATAPGSPQARDPGPRFTFANVLYHLGGDGRDRGHVHLHDARVGELRRLGGLRHRGAGGDSPGEYRDYHRIVDGRWLAMEAATLGYMAIGLSLVAFGIYRTRYEARISARLQRHLSPAIAELVASRRRTP